MPITEIERRYRQATAADMSIEVDAFAVAQTLLLPETGRAGSSMVVT